MAYHLTFSDCLHITEDESYFDSGAKYSVFPRWVGDELGLNIEAGEEVFLKTGAGLMPAYLHYLTLGIGNLVFIEGYTGLDLLVRALVSGAAGVSGSLNQAAPARSIEWAKAFYCFLEPAETIIATSPEHTAWKTADWLSKVALIRRRQKFLLRKQRIGRIALAAVYIRANNSAFEIQE